MSGQNNEKRIYSLLGLCKKGGFIASGEFMTEKSIKSGNACVVIVAGDSSDNTKKNFRDMCTFYEVPYYEFGDKDGLGACLGFEYRASLAVSNEGLGKKIVDLLETTSQ